jgi:hypothetical protein
MILSLDYFNGMGLQRFFSELATLPQLKQICPECSPLHAFSALSSSFLKFDLIDNLRMVKSQRLVPYEIL